MSKPEIIERIETELGITVPRVTSLQNNRYLPIHSPVSDKRPIIGRRGYVLDNQNRIVELGLSKVRSPKLQQLLVDSKTELCHMETLDLSWNQNIRDWQFITEISSLKSLDLSCSAFNEISLLSNLSNLLSLNLDRTCISNQSLDTNVFTRFNQLKNLHLSEVAILDWDFLNSLRDLRVLSVLNLEGNLHILSELRHLRSLKLYEADLGELKSLSKLEKLEGLDLTIGYNAESYQWDQLLHLPSLHSLTLDGIEDLEEVNTGFLNELVSLRLLSLNAVHLNDASFLEDLSELKHLYLYETSMDDYSELSGLGQLNKLETLWLGDGTDIDDWLYIDQLTNLRSLKLQLGETPLDLGLMQNLKKLIHLDISFCEVSDSSKLSELKELQYLQISSQENDLSWLGKLSDLRHLYLSAPEIEDISFLSELANLTSLELYDLQISDFTPIQTLRKLNILVMKRQNISNIDFSVLKHLKWLEIANSEITNCSFIQDLSDLTYVDLTGNKISSLPFELVDIGLNIRPIRYDTCYPFIISNNPIVTPPIEIVSQGNNAIRAYYDSLNSDGSKQFTESRIIIVGDGAAGKTSVLNQLQGLSFSDGEQQTLGINRVTLSSQNNTWLIEQGLSQNTRIHCWDFGGQEIMHMAHQFFLSERAIYILVIDSRTGGNPDYWLRHIDAFGGNSPVIVVINKTDTNPGFGLNETDLLKHFPQIEGRFIRVSCKTKQGIQSLQATIADVISTTQSDITISSRWLAIRDALVAKTESSAYVTEDGFASICRQYKIKDRAEQKHLLTFLHNLGVVLHYPEIPQLSVFSLDPNWLITGIYRILNAPQVANGVLNTTQDLDSILNPTEATTYNRQAQQFLLDVMQHFGLLYAQARNQYLVPSLLPKSTPALPLNSDATQLHFVVEFAFLPKSVIPQLMVRHQTELVLDYLWRNGMVLKDVTTDCQAVLQTVEADNRLHITITGPDLARQKYLAVLRNSLNAVTNNIRNLQCTEFIAVPGHPELLVELDELLELLDERETHYRVRQLKKRIPIATLLDSALTPQDQKSALHVHHHHYGEQANVVHSHGDNAQIQVGTRSSAQDRSDSTSSVTNNN